MNSCGTIAARYLPAGEAKCRLPVWRLLVLGVMAGMFIALAGVGATLAAVSVQAASVGKLLGACIFPAGLIMVVFTGSELFTGNNLLVIPVLARRVSLRLLVKNWVLVYIGNFIGAVLVALLVVYGHTLDLFGGAAAASVVSAAQAKVALSFGDSLLRGILCNLLVCLAVWMAMAADDAAGKILAIFFPILLFVLCGFEHCVANMYYIPAGIFAAAEYGLEAGGLSWGAMAVNNLLPVTLGNVLGGAGLGAVMWLLHLRNTGA